TKALAIEYFHSDFNHYFVTANPLEAATLDAVKARGSWTRTGQAYAVHTALAAGLAPVCRFFSASFAPKSSHFYTAEPAECAEVKASNTWMYEGDAFLVNRPLDG